MTVERVQNATDEEIEEMLIECGMTHEQLERIEEQENKLKFAQQALDNWAEGLEDDINLHTPQTNSDN